LRQLSSFCHFSRRNLIAFRSRPGNIKLYTPLEGDRQRPLPETDRGTSPANPDNLPAPGTDREFRLPALALTS
jgi:hypothetical protein